MKKTIAISSAVVAVMLMAGCSSDSGGTPTPAETASSPAATFPPPTPTPPPAESSEAAPDPSADPTLVGEEEAESSANMIEAGKLATQVIADGMTEEDAIALIEGEGYEVRVVSRDDEMFPVTMDYRESRFNLKVEDGKVTEITFG